MKADFSKGTKICSKCKRELPLEMFQKNCSASDGLTCRCKDCLSRKSMTEEEIQRKNASMKKFRASEKYIEAKERANERRRTDPVYKEKNRQRSHEYYHKNLAHPKELQEIEIDENGNEFFVCTKCGRRLSIDMFGKNSKDRLGINHQCKECTNTYKRELTKTDKYKEANRQKTARYRKTEKGKAYFDSYNKSEAGQESMKKYRESEKGKQKKSEYRKNLWENDIEFKVETTLRNRVRGAIKHGTKANHTIELIGCSIQDLKEHIESQFKPGMSWDNYNHKIWHIDHIVPCAAFDLTNPIHQRVCFNWMNLQPLWSSQNIRKKDRITEGSQELVDFIRDELGIEEEIVLKGVEEED